MLSVLHFASDLSATMPYNFKLNTIDSIKCRRCVLSLLQIQGYHKMTSFDACAKSACRDCCWQRLTQISTAPSQWGVFIFLFLFISSQGKVFRETIPTAQETRGDRLGKLKSRELEVRSSVSWSQMTILVLFFWRGHKQNSVYFSLTCGLFPTGSKMDRPTEIPQKLFYENVAQYIEVFYRTWCFCWSKNQL